MTSPGLMPKSYPIFLSSLCRELEELRERIFFDVGRQSQVYVDEKVKPRDTANQDDLETADELIRRVREARIFVCVLGGRRHGSLIKVGSRPSVVSFFEIELFQAALLGKEVHLFVRDEFEPEPRLESLLRILGGAFPEWVNKKRLKDGEILDQVRRLVDTEGRRRIFWPPKALWAPIRRLVQALCTARARPPLGTPLLFLGGQFEHRNKPPDLDVLSTLRERIKSLPNEEERLSRVWLGIRDLMSVHYTETEDRSFLKYWDEMLGEWARAGAWYGLHGDTPLGCLAALNSVAAVRQRLAEQHRSELPLREVAYPGGPLASAKYSIAKRLYIPSDRKRRLSEAFNDVQLALKMPAANEDGLLAIRGSILRQMHRFSAAIEDYESVLKIREQRKAAESSIGEALSELGYGYLCQGRAWKGKDYCEQGVRLLRRTETKGFLARGLRKLAVAYLATGHVLKSYEAWIESKQVAYAHGAFDQY